MTLFPTNAPSVDQKNRQTVGDPGNYPLGSSDWYFDAIARGQWERIRAQGFAEGMEAAAKIVDAIESNSIWPPFIAASIREASKTKGP